MSKREEDDRSLPRKIGRVILWLFVAYFVGALIWWFCH